MRHIKSYVAGMLTMTIIFACGFFSYAVSTSTLKNVITNGVKIVLNGKELHPTDVNGNTVEPMIYNGTTYLPVRAIATALNLPVSWDGPNFTVYLGDMDGTLDYPTVSLKDMVDIAERPYSGRLYNAKETDNYGNTYVKPYYYSNEPYGFVSSEFLLNMQYSRFKATFYVANGASFSEQVGLEIIADGRIIYSGSLDKTSRPIELDLDVTGCNSIKINMNGPYIYIGIADAGVYQ